MAAVVNDRDVLIMATTPRYTVANDRGLFVTPSAAIFKLGSTGATASPSSYAFTATLLNIPGTVKWSWTDGVAPKVSGNTLTLAFADMSAVSATITAAISVDGENYVAIATVAKVSDGTIGLNGSRGTINISAPTAGVVWSDSDAKAAIANDGYGAPINRDVVTLYNQAGKFSKTKFWDGDSWEDVSLVLDGNLLVPGSVNAQSLAVDAVKASTVLVSGNGDNIIPDPRFKDPSWWGFTGYTNVLVADWLVNQPSVNTSWKLGCSMYLYAAPSNAYQEIFTKYFPVIKGATYLIEFQISVSQGFSGNVAVEWYLPYVAWYGINQPQLGTFSDGGPVHYNASSSGTFRTVAATLTLPDDSRLSLAAIRIRHQITAGNLEFGSFIITRVNDSVLIKDGAVTAQKIYVNSLQAITGVIGTLQTATSGQRTQLSDNGLLFFTPSNVPVIEIGYF